MLIRERTMILRLALLAALIAAATFLALRPAQAGPVTIDIGNFYFCSPAFSGDVCETTIPAGTTIEWDFEAGTHTTTECGNDCGAILGSPETRLWHSGNRDSGTFERTFDNVGTFNYQCNIHPSLMQGRIIVEAAPPTSTPTVTNTPGAPTATATETAVPPTATHTPVGPTATATSTTVPPTATDTPEPSGVVGDANGDNLVNAIDATLVLQFVADFLDSLPSTADANVSGNIDAIDAALILQFVAGLVANLPP